MPKLTLAYTITAIANFERKWWIVPEFAMCATPPRRPDGYAVEFDAREEFVKIVVLVTSAVTLDEADGVAAPPSAASGSSSAQLGSVDRIVALFSSDKPSSFEKPS